MADELLRVEGLKKYFPVKRVFGKRKASWVKAVDDVSFSIRRGETFGLVGESGCGKTTVGRTLIRLYNPTGGRIVFDGDDISSLTQKEMLPYRKRIQMIFQDPYSSLDARMTVGDIIGESLDIYKLAEGEERRRRIARLLDDVGLKRDHASRYPHEFSGGQRQRVGIARALAVEPEFIICDEPISALDVSIQAQIVNMLEDIQKKRGITYLFIAHDLSMVRHISDRIAVMYLGQIVEIGPSDDLYDHPAHPYTKALLSAIPRISSRPPERELLKGDVPSPIDPPPGCRFAPRCAFAQPICRREDPVMKDLGGGRRCACHLF